MGAQSTFGTAVFDEIGSVGSRTALFGSRTRPFWDGIDEHPRIGSHSAAPGQAPRYGHNLPMREGILPRKHWAKWLSQAQTSELALGPVENQGIPTVTDRVIQTPKGSL